MIEKITIDGKEYIPSKCVVVQSCMGCSFFKEDSCICEDEPCRSLPMNTILKGTEQKSPTLDDFTTITSYEDACEALGERPWLNEIPGTIFDLYRIPIGEIPAHIVALMKLETISRALWGRNFTPLTCKGEDNMFYMPPFALMKKEDIQRYADEGGFEEILMAKKCEETATSIGFTFEKVDDEKARLIGEGSYRLWQETYNKALYFGSRYFVPLWKEYLGFPSNTICYTVK